MTLFYWNIVLHYLNDFFAILFSHVDSHLYQTQFDDLCLELEIKVNNKKSVCFTTTKFLDIELNIVLIKTRLSIKKLERARKIMTISLEKRHILHSDLKSLMRFLFFVAKVVIFERTFLRRLFDALRSDLHLYYITITMRRDLQWWHRFLSTWNDIKMLKSRRQTYHIWTNVFDLLDMRDYILINLIDVSMKTFNHRFATRFKRLHINVKKMIAVLFAIRKWLNILKETHLHLYDDNFVVVFDLQKRSINDFVMSSLRDICMLLARHDIVVSSIWISTKNNVLVDMLSRFQFEKIVDIYS